MAESSRAALEPPTFPHARWAALAWVLLWAPVYARHYGWANFLALCDVAILITAAGLWTGSPLLLSTQAVSALVAQGAWALDVGWRLVSGRHLVGGTEYMWDTRFPLWLRLLSLYHVALPVVLLWALRRVGYDPRALAVQTGLVAALIAVSRLADPARNLNYAFRDPFLGQALEPWPLHVAASTAAVFLLVHWPTHRLLRAVFRPAHGRSS